MDMKYMIFHLSLSLSLSLTVEAGTFTVQTSWIQMEFHI